MRVLLSSLLVFFLSVNSLWAAMTSTNFQINWDNLNDGGLDSATSTNYQTHDTLGEASAGGSGTSTNYQTVSGYRAGEEASTVLSLTVKSQETSTETAYTSFNAGSSFVVVASASSFSANDYIAVVENKGSSQLVAVGKISSIFGTTLTVDGWGGATSSMSATPAGDNDVVYRLGTATAAFGTISASVVNTTVTMLSANVTHSTGYTVYLQASQILQNTSGQTITSVADGSVNGTAEEYGVAAAGTTAQLGSSDVAVTTTQLAVQSRTAASASPADRVAITYKLAVTPTTNNGSYSQSIYYTLTANY